MSEQTKEAGYTGDFRAETVQALEALSPFYDLKGNEQAFLTTCRDAREFLSSPIFNQDHPTIRGLLSNDLTGATPCVERVVARMLGRTGRGDGQGINVNEMVGAWLLRGEGGAGLYGKYLDGIRERKKFPPISLRKAAQLIYGLVIIRRGVGITKADYTALDALVDYRMGDKRELAAKRLSIKHTRLASTDFQGLPALLSAPSGSKVVVPYSRTIDGKTYHGEIVCRIEHNGPVVLLPYFPRVAKVAFSVAKKRKVQIDGDDGMTLYCATYEEIATAYAGNSSKAAVAFVKEALNAMRNVRLCDIEFNGELWDSDAFEGVPTDTALFPSEQASVRKYGKRTAGELIHGIPLFCRLDDGLDRTVDIRVGSADDDTGVRPWSLYFTKANESIYSMLEDRLIQLSRTYKTNPRVLVGDIIAELDRLGLVDGVSTERGARGKRQRYTETIESILQHWVDNGMAYVRLERDGKNMTAFELAMPYCPTRRSDWLLPSTPALIRQHNEKRKALEEGAAAAAKGDLLDEKLKREKKGQKRYSDEEAEERLKDLTQKHLNKARKEAMQRAIFTRQGDIIDAEEEGF